MVIMHNTDDGTALVPVTKVCVCAGHTVVPTHAGGIVRVINSGEETHFRRGSMSSG